MDGYNVTITVSLVTFINPFCSNYPTSLFKDDASLKTVLAYKKGGERERFNPLTGQRYEKQQTHDIDIEDQEGIKQSHSSNLQPFSNRQLMGPSRSRKGFFRGNEEGSRWKGKGRSNSPYQKPSKDNNTKSADNSVKAKDKP